MGAECCYQLSQIAYIKLVLHALKHRSAAVNGLLQDGSAPAFVIADAVPLSHAQIGLLPALELALIQMAMNASVELDIRRGLARSFFPKKIGDHIFRYFSRAAVPLLDNKRLQKLPTEKGSNPVVQLYTRDSSKSWRQTGSEGSNQLTLKEPAANTVLLDYISSEKWQEIIVFDDHLDDVCKDWLNPGLFI